MTQKRLYELAERQLLAIWAKENELLEANPENRIAQAREKKAWAELVQCKAERLAIEK